MVIKKSELYSLLRKSCNQLRGVMDSSQYKDYVLTLLFVKYMSDKYADNPNSFIKIPAGGSFANIFALKGDKDIGYKINKAIEKLAKANNLEGVIDVANFNDEDKLGKASEMQDRLSNLLSIFNDLDFSSNCAEGNDLIGNAYEYLMCHFSIASVKSKGLFYTPAEVSRVMAKVIGIDKTRPGQTVYDPTCGSGSLLLKAVNESPNGLSIYGQEIDVNATALAKMNMILHGHKYAKIASGGYSTLSSPAFTLSSSELETFDFVVANPPYSIKAWQNGFPKDEKTKTVTDSYGRFDYGVPSPGNGDYAFLMHIVCSLKNTGKGAVIFPHGVLFRGNNADSTIRKELINRGYIKGVINLPENLFCNTSIPVCIIVLSKENAAQRKGIFMVNASKCFVKEKSKNRLRARDIHKIVDVFNKELEIEGFSRLVPISEISNYRNDYNLTLSRYIDNSDKECFYDLTPGLEGVVAKSKIDGLQSYWNVFTSSREALFKQNANPDYLTFLVSSDQIESTIMNSPEYQAYAKKVEATLKLWKDKCEPYLKSLEIGCKPKDVIWKISEDLLSTFSNTALIDKYDVYQRLIDYWDETMQDDIYQISFKGWKKYFIKRSHLSWSIHVDASHFINKWFDRLSADTAAEVKRVTMGLVNYLIDLKERRSIPLSVLTNQFLDCSNRLEKHLKKLGLS